HLAHGHKDPTSFCGVPHVTTGKMLVDGEEIKDGTRIEGLGTVSPDFATRNIITDNLLEINKSTVDELAEKGL
ncbi:MAG: autoinducer 2 ABC transporter substrate-binding protein, partial [Pseudomonadota bacterium]